MPNRRSTPPAWGSSTPRSSVKARVLALRSFCVHHQPAAVLAAGRCGAGIRYLDIGLTIRERPCHNGHFLPDPVKVCPLWKRMEHDAALAQARLERKALLTLCRR